ncbi:ParA family protein [Staphylococcus saprophyticus]|uniref:ParA family protein n=1 Tax=Staphylococcus cohnii TaxID=29382 RepID=A0ABT6J2S8_9STAP|nr:MULTISPECIES: ParA family protein [Staphylococcus]MDH5140526.1 ParA family protein [Staphylococcus cohnii]MDH5159052.1 ParA family protein [Staphylococcus cohnii]MDH5170110.1 ParA family protein [Staphylococcus cohnii]MDW3800412.1 ParA family protein [Staphylococcus saprophyticus]MDW3983229.1 ParA family protein [Staphylococcus saprophyticus]
MVKVITVNNFKGGVSKTSTTNGIAYTLAEKMNYKTLVIDIDPQADATDTLLLSFKGKVKNSLYETFENRLDVSNCIVNLSKNLDLIPSDFNMIGFPQLLDDLGYSRTNGSTLLNKLISSIKNDYDYILIDTPPTISDYSSNAIYACDYSLIVMQTHRRSYKAVEKFVEYLAIFKDNNQLDFEIAGILPVMFKRDGKVDKSVIEDAKEKYGDYLFDNYIYQRDRVKLWDETGITDEDFHDKRALKMYYDITENLLKEIEEYESE